MLAVVVVVANALMEFLPLFPFLLPRKQRKTHGVTRERLNERLPERLDERVGVHGVFEARETVGRERESRCRRLIEDAVSSFLPSPLLLLFSSPIRPAAKRSS